MGKLNALSYLFFSIAVIAKIIESTFITSHFFYSHYLNFTLLIVIVSPFVGIILASFGKGKKTKWIAIALNGIFLFLFSPLALLNLWIINFGK
ncbi:hypothetical protein [Neobacillus sp.]|uniref:hypothetical protein n=1 Tax=Neobacillus sp. TaxID=2675273 RepID=UPI00289F7379|nr:hypothetical protein [Neobacillus sp.]